jgi:hypothetical protein
MHGVRVLLVGVGNASLCRMPTAESIPFVVEIAGKGKGDGLCFALLVPQYELVITSSMERQRLDT